MCSNWSHLHKFYYTMFNIIIFEYSLMIFLTHFKTKLKNSPNRRNVVYFFSFNCTCNFSVLFLFFSLISLWIQIQYHYYNIFGDNCERSVILPDTQNKKLSRFHRFLSNIQYSWVKSKRNPMAKQAA